MFFATLFIHFPKPFFTTFHHIYYIDSVENLSRTRSAKIFLVQIFLFVFPPTYTLKITTLQITSVPPLLPFSFTCKQCIQATNSNNTNNLKYHNLLVHIFCSCFTSNLQKFHHPVPNCLPLSFTCTQRMYRTSNKYKTKKLTFLTYQRAMFCAFL